RWCLSGRRRHALRQRRWWPGRYQPMSAAVVELENVSRVYSNGRLEVAALKGVDVRVEQGEFAAVVGPSGSGKSTLMHIIGCLDRPTSGSYKLTGRPVEGLD